MGAEGRLGWGGVWIGPREKLGQGGIVEEPGRVFEGHFEMTAPQRQHFFHSSQFFVFFWMTIVGERRRRRINFHTVFVYVSFPTLFQIFTISKLEHADFQVHFLF